MNNNKIINRSLVLLGSAMLCSGLALAGNPHLMPKRNPGELTSMSAPAGSHLNYYGGKVVSNMEVVQVLWGSGSYSSQVASTGTPSVASFYQGVLNSVYIDWLSEYDTNIKDYAGYPGTNQHIGRGAFVGQVKITPSTSAKTIDDSVIQAELSKQIAAGNLPTPSVDANGNNNTYYAIYFPSGITITMGGSASCQQFCAYHGTVDKTTKLGEFYYGVHPDFQSGSGCDVGCGNSSSTFNNITSVASHEMIETMTDCEVGLASTDAPPLAWYNDANGEIGDICNAQQGTVVGSDGVTYTVQKEYSNIANNCIVSRTTSGNTAPTITSANNTVFTAGTPGSFTVTATGTPSPTFSMTGTLPSGVSFSSSGVLSGTPVATASGTYQVTITASNGTSPNATQNFVLTVGNFSISTSTPSQTVSGGQTAVYTVNLAAPAGLGGTVALSCTSGQRRCTMTPSSLVLNGNATATGKIYVSYVARRGTYIVTFKAQMGNLVQKTTATLIVR